MSHKKRTIEASFGMSTVCFHLPFWIMDEEFYFSKDGKDYNRIEEKLFELGASQVCLNHQVWCEFEIEIHAGLYGDILKKRVQIEAILKQFCKKEQTTMKNECLKMRPKENPYEVWQSFDGSWTWNVLKKWQADDNKPYARWFCNVVTPICPYGELGDVYVRDIKRSARKVK